MNIQIMRNIADIAEEARRILNSDASDEAKYSLIFSDDISGRVRSYGVRLDYYDPDTSYIEDATAYVLALESKVEEFGELVARCPLCKRRHGHERDCGVLWQRESRI